MPNPLENNMVLYYLNALGSGLANPDDPMQQVGAVTKQTIAAQSQMNLIKKFLSGGGNLSQKEGRINYTGDVSAFLKGDEKSALGTTAPSALTGDVGNLYRPKAAPGGGGGGMDASKLMMMDLLGGGNALNPSDSSLDISSADLVGLTPENITQALQLKFMSEELGQKKLSDFAKIMQPAEVKDERTTKVKNYEYYLEQEKAAGRIPKSMEEWDTGLVKERRLYDEAVASGMKKEENPFHRWLFNWRKAGATDINIGEQVIQRSRSKDIAYVTGIKISQDITEMLDRDPERLREQSYVEKYMGQGMTYEAASIRARKAAHRVELLRQFQAVYDRLGKTSTFGKEGIEVDGVLKQRYQ